VVEMRLVGEVEEVEEVEEELPYLEPLRGGESNFSSIIGSLGGGGARSEEHEVC